MNTTKNSVRHPSDLAGSGAWSEPRQGSDGEICAHPRFRDGWWFLPAAVFGLVVWVLIIRAVIGWLA